MSAESALSKSYQVGPRYRVLFSAAKLKPGASPVLVAEWTPRQPRRMSPQETDAYRAARHEFLMELLVYSGTSGDIAVVEVQ